jgi:hypothetical protein
MPTVRVCVCVCARACLCVRVRVCVCACVRMYRTLGKCVYVNGTRTYLKRLDVTRCVQEL